MGYETRKENDLARRGKARCRVTMRPKSVGWEAELRRENDSSQESIHVEKIAAAFPGSRALRRSGRGASEENENLKGWGKPRGEDSGLKRLRGLSWGTKMRRKKLYLS